MRAASANASRSDSVPRMRSCSLRPKPRIAFMCHMIPRFAIWRDTLAWPLVGQNAGYPPLLDSSSGLLSLMLNRFRPLRPCLLVNLLQQHPNNGVMVIVLDVQLFLEQPQMLAQ
jgi:hypothetical protein